MKYYKFFVISAFVIYLYIVFHITLIDRSVGQRRHMIELFWEYKKLFETHSRYWVGQIGGNIIMLMPLGFMLPLISKKFKKFTPDVLTGFLLSCFIETVQYFTGRGLFEFDDIFNNTLGCFIGFFIYNILSNL